MPGTVLGAEDTQTGCIDTDKVSTFTNFQWGAKQRTMKTSKSKSGWDKCYIVHLKSARGQRYRE